MKAGQHFLLQQGSDEWLQARRRYAVTGSEFAAAIGVSPFCSRAKLWRLKTGREREEEDDFRDACLEHGRRHETEARDALSAFLGQDVREVGLFELECDPRFASSPDGMTALSGEPVEIKCPLRGDPLAGPREDQVVQCYAHMACTGTTACHFFNFDPEGPGRYTKVTWEKDTWDRIYAWLEEFAGYVREDVPPPRLVRRRKLP